MTMPEATCTPELRNGQYTDLQTLHSELNLLGSQGVTRVIIAINKPHTVTSGTESEYMMLILGNFPGSPPLQNSNDPLDGRMLLVGDAALDKDRVPHHAWVTESDFECGAHARIVVDPQEVGGVDFSWDSSEGSTAAVEKMEFVKDLLLVF